MVTYDIPRDYDLRTQIAIEAKAWRQLHESILRENPNARILGMHSKGPYMTMGEYVLDKGHAYEPAQLTDFEYTLVVEALRKARKQGYAFARNECFRNAQALVLASPGHLKYVEGFFRSVMPIHHAWASINGKVIDTTMRFGRMLGGVDHGPQRARVAPALHRMKLSDRIYGIWWEEAAYFGVEFDRLDVLKHYETECSKITGALLDNPDRIEGKII